MVQYPLKSRLWVPVAALAEQGLTSAASFIIVLVAARRLSPEAFGQLGPVLTSVTFAVALNTAWLGLAIHRAIAVDPAADWHWLRIAARRTLWHAALWAGAFSLGITLLTNVRLGIAGALLVAGAVVADTLRRLNHATGRFGKALAATASLLIAQAALVPVLDRWPSPVAACLAVAATTAVAICVQMPRRPRSVTSSSVDWTNIERSTRWSTVTTGVGFVSTALLPWLLLTINGPSEAGIFSALMAVAGVANPILQGVYTLTLRSATRNHGRASIRLLLVGQLLLLPVYMGLLLWPELLTCSVYGEHSIVSSAPDALRPLALVILFNSGTQWIRASLDGMGASWPNARTEILVAAATTVLAPTAAAGGARYTVLLLAVAAGLRAFLTFRAAGRHTLETISHPMVRHVSA
jgi:O-antigen/teichoic acid export membrane protein